MSCSFVANVDERVIKQIQVREEKFGKSPKTDKELMIIHGNCPWVVLRSGVDAPVHDSDRWKPFPREEPERCLVTNDWAKKTVLGGELQNRSGDGTVRPHGIQVSPKGRGIDPESGIFLDTAYRITDYQGHRPVAGITDVTVTTRDTWGMVMEATIRIKCWSRDELDLLDRVYFKPGYTALLEWGHTLYFKEDGTECVTPSQMISDEEFFKGGPYSDLDLKVLEKRKEDSNREALFGTITNFSYSFNKDGSYDCSLKMLSKGSVIRGLRVKGINQFASPCSNSTTEDEQVYEDVSIWHRIHQAFISFDEKPDKRTVPIDALNPVDSPENYDKLPSRAGAGTGDDSYFNGKEAIEAASARPTKESTETCKLFDSGKLNDLQNFPVIAVPLKIKHLGGGGRKNKEFYITLRSLLHLINTFNSEGRKIKFNLWDTAEYVEPDLKSPVEAVSLNPYVAVKPKQSGTDYDIESGQGNFQKLVNIEHFNDQQSKKILNIWINFGQFVYSVDNQIDGKVSDYSILEALQNLLGNIQKVFGNINEFQIVSDHKHGSTLFSIIDTKCIEAEDNDTDNIPKIRVTGLQNTITDLKVTSEVSSDTANEMSIAAQAPRTYEDSSESADETMIHWGENCENRWVFRDESTPTDFSEDSSTKATYTKNENQWVRKLKKAYESVRKGKIKNSGERIGRNTSNADSQNMKSEAVQAAAEELFRNLQLDGEAYFHELRAVEVTGPKKPNLQMGIIPIRVGLTMMGISNLTIGNVFRIESGVLLPKYYTWAQIITGIEHRISSAGWTTTLKTQYYPVYYGDNSKKLIEPTGYSTAMQSTVNQNVASGRSSAYARKYRDPKALEETCNMYDAMTEYAGYTWGGSQGHCARYTYGWARAYALGKNAITEPDRKTWTGYAVPAVPAGGNANQSSYHNSLKNLGYKEQTVKTGMTPAQITEYARKNCGEGDVLVYFPIDENGDPTATGHTQFNTGHGWVSDFPQASEWSNSGSKNNTKPSNYKLIHFKAPKRSQDWCEV